MVEIVTFTFLVVIDLLSVSGKSFFSEWILLPLSGNSRPRKVLLSLSASSSKSSFHLQRNEFRRRVSVV